jgi:PAS domain S-box-containing protein
MLRDITIRKQAEAALRAAHDELDRRVQERTQELSQANQALQAEIAERRRAEQALKQSEEKYRLLAENVTDVIWATDLNLHFIYVSPSVFGLCGYTAEEIVDRSIDEILTPASVQIATATLAEELAREQGSPTLDPARSVIIELEQIRKGGGVVPIEIKVTFLRNTTGQPVGVLGVTRDITQRRQAEELVRASLREKETLLQEIHHRVKNNLQVISSLLNLQSAHVQDTQADKIFRDSQHRIRSMALIHEKLYRSENLAGIDFAEYVRDLALSLFRSYNAGAQGIALAMRADSVFLGIDKAVPCGLLLNELIANSLKHAFPADRDGPDAQAGQIRIELYAAPEGQVTLVVGDNGVGLPPDLDVHNTTSLGLQLIHTLANQLGGTVQLGRDQGTEFKITFVAQEPVKK